MAAKNNPKPKPIEIPPKMVLPPTTTHEDNLIAEGQRKINALWEQTQAAVAISVVSVTVIVDGTVTIIFAVNNGQLSVSQLFALTFLHLICLNVIQAYFQRTNHQIIGGVPKGYKGR